MGPMPAQPCINSRRRHDIQGPACAEDPLASLSRKKIARRLPGKGGRKEKDASADGVPGACRRTEADRRKEEFMLTCSAFGSCALRVCALRVLALASNVCGSTITLAPTCTRL